MKATKSGMATWRTATSSWEPSHLVLVSVEVMYYMNRKEQASARGLLVVEGRIAYEQGLSPSDRDVEQPSAERVEFISLWTGELHRARLSVKRDTHLSSSISCSPLAMKAGRVPSTAGRRDGDAMWSVSHARAE